MRPRTLAEFLGQGHLVDEGRVLRRLIEADRIPSMILWGPPGSGKTTLARVIAGATRSVFETLSATSAGVKDVRAVVERARVRRGQQAQTTLLFIDEIHRFNKSQQDALLPHVESGLCRLVGATTENPSFEVNGALLSRARVFRLRSLSDEALVELLRRAMTDGERGLAARGLTASPELLGTLAHAADGDARRALSMLEVAAELVAPGTTILDEDSVREAVGGRTLRHDKAGEEHYNIVSAFIKSMRASDGDAAVYWLARLLEAGDDAMFVARRLMIFAAEDVGNADPNALVVATAAAHATHWVGLPEARLPLTQATLYLALAPKSNTSLTAYGAAAADVEAHGGLPVPMALRNPVTGLMKSEGYGKGYVYPHDLPEGVPAGESGCLPEALQGRRYVQPAARGWEGRAWQALQERRARGRGDE